MSSHPLPQLADIHQLLETQRPLVKGWILEEEQVKRRERYLMAGDQTIAIDQDRQVTQRDVQLRLWVTLDRAGKQGEISTKLFSSEPLQEQLQVAIRSAQQTEHQAWELQPSVFSENLPSLLTADPLVLDNLNQVIEDTSQTIAHAVSQLMRQCPARFHSAELFASLHNRQFLLSNGFSHHSQQSRLFTEAAYSHHIGETLRTRWAIHRDQWNILDFFQEVATQSLHIQEATRPKTGHYAVLLHADVLATLFWDAVSQLSSAHAYHRLPFLAPGSEFISGASRGDLITLSLDPLMPFGADTVSVSTQGLPQKPLTLVSENRVIASQTDLQFGTYLGIAPTTTRGNLKVSPGTHTRAALLQGAQEPVLEIFEFSGLFTDPHTRTFSSEIRLGCLHHSGKPPQWIRGGSLSGSLSENFQHVLLSKECSLHTHFSSDASLGQTYLGPQFGLIHGVSVVGEHT